MPNHKNRWRIQVLEAALTHNTELLGKMDPFVTLKTCGQSWKTSVAEDQGKTPRWRHERMKLIIEGDVPEDEELEIIVEDKEKRGADLIGHCKVKLASLIKDNHSEWIDLTWEHGSAGRVHLKIRSGVRNREESNKRSRKKPAKDESSSSSSSESESEFEAAKELERQER
jgi:C2 domain